MSDERQQPGTDGERAAEKFLRGQRYTILQRNYRCRAGEVDLIALDHSTVVFIKDAHLHGARPPGTPRGYGVDRGVAALPTRVKNS